MLIITITLHLVFTSCLLRLLFYTVKIQVNFHTKGLQIAFLSTTVRVHPKLWLVDECTPPGQSAVDGGGTVYNQKTERQLEMHPTVSLHDAASDLY
jgi:hypothetical protein